jgi:hypothetical protein
LAAASAAEVGAVRSLSGICLASYFFKIASNSGSTSIKNIYIIHICKKDHWWQTF